MVPNPSLAGTKVLRVLNVQAGGIRSGVMPTGRLTASPWDGGAYQIAGVAGPWYRLPWAKGIVGF